MRPAVRVLGALIAILVGCADAPTASRTPLPLPGGASPVVVKKQGYVDMTVTCWTKPTTVNWPGALYDITVEFKWESDYEVADFTIYGVQQNYLVDPPSRKGRAKARTTYGLASNVIGGFYVGVETPNGHVSTDMGSPTGQPDPRFMTCDPDRTTNVFYAILPPPWW